MTNKTNVAATALDEIQGLTKGKHAVEIAEVWHLIEPKLEQKFPVKSIFNALTKAGVISCTYAYFNLVVRRRLETDGEAALHSPGRTAERLGASDNLLRPDDAVGNASAPSEQTLGMSESSANLAEIQTKMRGTNYAKQVKNK